MLSYGCQRILALGLSVRKSQDFDVTMNVTKLDSSYYDNRGHYKMNRKTVPGDSGGGVFDFETEKLCGVMISPEYYTKFKANRYTRMGHVIKLDHINVLSGFSLGFNL